MKEIEMKILSFGEILWDVYPDEAYIGGAPFNFAAHSVKQGGEAYMLSALGNDELGIKAKSELRKHGVLCDYVTFYDEFETGKCLVTLDENSVPSYNLLNNVAYDFIPSENVPNIFYVLYFGTLALRSEYNFSSIKSLVKTNSFKEIFVDVNIRAPFYSEDRVRFAVENATMLKISLEELKTVGEILGINADDYKTFAKELYKNYRNLNCVIITLGPDGAYALDCKTQQDYSCGCNDVKVVSTVGAGDSFSASFLNKYLKGANLTDCLMHATRIAELVVSSAEAIPDYIL